jgi:tRNA(Ile)-lysidine synthase
VVEQFVRAVRESALLRPGDRVAAAVSGGADSVALLRLLLNCREELGIVLSIAHFNHKLRGQESEADEQFVVELAHEHSLQLHRGCADTAAHAQQKRLSREAAARELRYQFFRKLLYEEQVGKICTAHTQDDQAETVLLRLLRGSGTRGLAGIYPVRHLGQGAIVRPLLQFRRDELREYLRSLGQTWREDQSNIDLSHTRNRVRHQLLPLIEREFNPGIIHVLSDAAEIAREEEEYWQQELARLFQEIVSCEENSVAIKTDRLLAVPVAVQRRLLHAAAEAVGVRLQFHQVIAILGLAREKHAGRRYQISGEWEACFGRGQLRLERVQKRES